MLNVKVTRLHPVVSPNANKLRAIADIEVGNGLMIYGLMYKLNKDNEYYVQMPQHIGRDGDYHSTVEPLSKEFAARIKAEIEKANIEGKNYTPTSEDSEPLRFTFSLRNGANNSTYGDMRVNDELIVHNISVKNRLDPESGEPVKFISMPSKQADNGQWWSVVRASNDTVKDAINRYGIAAIGKIAVETIGNTKYKDLKETSPDLSYYRYQNVNYGKAVGEELSKAGIQWSGKVEKTGMVITISADEADSYTRILSEMREHSKAQTEQQAQTQAAEKLDESAFLDTPC
ncbi:MAG: septation protein SpoVG family protein [Ruminiclostridium sp.]